MEIEHGVDGSTLARLISVLAVVAAMPSYSSELPLFSRTEPVHIELVADWNALCRAEDPGRCAVTPATLSYGLPGGERQSIPVGLRHRGRWRLSDMRCTYPSLFIEFKSDDVKGTLFEGQFSLPFTSHCLSHERRSASYVLKEYLAYRIYTLHTAKSISARLALVTYLHDSGRSENREYPAFFTEHFESVAARNDSYVFHSNYINAGALDPFESSTLSVFQYLIGNTDWSMIAGHNTAAMRTEDGAISLLPFDFDYSGLVNTRYAVPPEKLPIRRVTQRLFRGFCYPALDWDDVYRQFLEKKADVFALTTEIERHSAAAARQARSYLEGFYRTLESPKNRRKRIEQSCRPILSME